MFNFLKKKIMREEERIAQDLLIFLKSKEGTGKLNFEIEGAGVHWGIEASSESRSISISCFNYEINDSAMVMGMRGNAHLSKVNVGKPNQFFSGAEYYANYKIESESQTTGRTRNKEDMVESVVDWLLENVDLDTLHTNHDFVDTRRRALIKIRDEVNSQLETFNSKYLSKLDNESPSYEFAELWVHSDDKACKLAQGGEAISCAFLKERTQLACVENATASTIAEGINLWINLNGTTKDLSKLFPDFIADPNAEPFEKCNHAVWHWSQVLKQAEYDEILMVYKPLIERIVKHPKLSQFFSFTSLHRLCLSRSSLYPFDTDGLPLIYPNDSKEKPYSITYDDEKYEELSLDDLVSTLEENVSLEPKPYFGSLDDYLFIALNNALEEIGSPHEAEKEFDKQWVEVIMKNNDGRKCEFSIFGNKEKVRVDFYEEGLNETRYYKGPILEVARKASEWISNEE